MKSKKSYLYLPVSIICILSNILACKLLIPKFGAQGAAIAIAISSAIYFISRKMIAFRYYQFKIYYGKLAYHITYICLLILLSGFCVYYSLIVFIFFIISSSLLEKKLLNQLKTILSPYIKSFSHSWAQL